ncbi:uncharacterized protein K452DRAFT_208217 [Neofusicoccum parvum]|uniref:Uncharacterized protein K452DRAFT_208217, partial n=1 Tax=Neofusicoccum parvum TaxID=310453 RepID=A0ACB5RS78_9PEZI|nr:uncharacterized protein K452DRAFT_208217 [Neofusicoccum parvum]
MFTTFHGTGPRETTASNRPKRSQVHRACDWCKLIRTKCDNHRPCHTCQQAGRECATNGQNHFRSIAAAAKEVERLRAQVRDLERRMAPSSAYSSRRSSLADAYTARPSASWNGVCSLPYFLRRMSLFLETALRQPQLDIASHTHGTSTPVFSAADGIGGDFLQRSQEDYFLDLFWQAHHFSYPIINELDFRKQYQALWANSAPDAPRQPSPLADIVLALCVQLGTSFIPHATGPDTPLSQEPCYSTLAGFQYYQRCHALLAETMETPSITTVQCYIFSIVYLYEAGLLNRAQIMTGEAIMMAIILGLNSEPAPDEPEPQQEMTRRTWWSLYILDAQLGIEVGRPFMIVPSHSTCKLPSDSPEIARSLGPHYMFDDSGITWLGFQNQSLRLLDTIRDITSAFFAKCDAVVSEINAKDFYSNGAAREECARFLTEQMKQLSAWAKSVPVGYRMPRRGGEPFSTDRSPLDLDHNVPIHYQRQRLLLELQYHLHALSLYRPFICFTPTPESSTPLSDSKATSSLTHAIALTNLLHQALTASEMLSGMTQVFRWQKNALFTMLGFAYTYPVSHHTAATRNAVSTAIAVVELYRGILPEASSVAAIARSLAANIDAIISGFRGGGRSRAAPATTAAAAPPADSIKAEARSSSSSSSSRPQTAGGASSSSAGASPAVDDRLDFRYPGAADDADADATLDLRFLQKVSGAADWGDMDALWASLEPQGGGGGGAVTAESWASFEEALVGLGEGGGDGEMVEVAEKV